MKKLMLASSLALMAGCSFVAPPTLPAATDAAGLTPSARPAAVEPAAATTPAAVPTVETPAVPAMPAVEKPSMMDSLKKKANDAKAKAEGQKNCMKQGKDMMKKDMAGMKEHKEMTPEQKAKMKEMKEKNKKAMKDCN